MGKESSDTQGNAFNSMSKETIKNLCKKHKLYVTPKLNDVLYLHYQGFQKIECLEEYTGLRCLWLDCNAIAQISGLESQEELRCLYLQNNFIKKIENLQRCSKLDTLNLSHNFIKRVESCDSSILPVLNTLNLSHNTLNSIEGLEGLVNCKTLSVLDLSHNRIGDILLVKILSRMPELRVLTLTGNPVINEIPAYRKTLIIECKKLTYLDSRPVFDRDRDCAEAWKRGGFEEEKKEHEKWIKAKQQKISNCVRATLKLKGRIEADTESDSDVESDGVVPREEDKYSTQDMETTHNDRLSGNYPTSLEGVCQDEKRDITKNYRTTEAEIQSTDLLPTERMSVSDANKAAIVKKFMEESNRKSAIESIANNKILLEVLSEEESNVNANADIIDSAVNSTIENKSCIIFHCENLNSLKLVNNEVDDD